MTNQDPAFMVGQVPIYGTVMLAPLAGYSDQPYRTICRSMGSAMSYTECIPASGFLHGNRRTLEMARFDPAERPLIMQAIGSEPDEIIQACRQFELCGADIVDINMGCPVPQVARRGGGAALLLEPAKIVHIFATLSRDLGVPVTGKIRLGWDPKTRNYLEIARLLEDNGAAMIAVHGRTRADRYQGAADWDAIAEVKATVHVPVIGNGDVHCAADIERMQLHTGSDGVMIGRAAIGNPWIFQRRDHQDVPLDERLAMVRYHLSRMVSFYGEKRAVRAFRKHVVRYLRGIPGAAHVRSLLMTLDTEADVLACLEEGRYLHPTENVL